MKTPAIIYIITLFLLAILSINCTSSTLNNSYTLNIRWDYLVHALVYIPLIPLLSFNKANTIKSHSRLFATSPTLIIVALTIAISLEAIQYIIPWRTFNINDMFSNILGVGIGFVLMKIIFRNR